MNILWITNILFPEALQLLGRNNVHKSSGGWMLSTSEALSSIPEVSLTIATVSNIVKELTFLKGPKANYYILPIGKGNTIYNAEYEKYWRIVRNNIQPSIIHIHGTEFTHGLSYVRACGNRNVVVSIQGLKSEIAKYYFAGISKRLILQNMSLRDFVMGGLFREKKATRNTGRLEIDMIKSIDHVIGRTTWDKAHCFSINPQINYHFCNETLRKEFYDGRCWNYENCHPHSIFLSQARYPLKGVHQVMKAASLVKKQYPDIKIRITGDTCFKNRPILSLLKDRTYTRIIRYYINKYQLHDNVEFVGFLDAESMVQEYLKANLFICPSSVENSPNSLGEAQVLGVPCLASYTGGIPDMMKNNESNLYMFEDIEVLALKISNIFQNAIDTTQMRTIALDRHNGKENIQNLLDIYKKILHHG